MLIHPTAVVDPNAILADDVKVGPYSIIGPEVEIGSGTIIESHVVIKGPTKIGKDNHFYPFSSIGEDPQDVKFHGEKTYLEIGDRNRVREFCTFNRGTPTGGSITKIGNDNFILAYCHIAHDCIVGNHIVMANNSTLGGHVIVEDKAKLGGFTVVHQFCRLGYACFTGGDTLIIQDVPPFTLIGGEASNSVGINKIGLQRDGYDENTIRAINKAYRKMIFVRGGDREEKLNEIHDLISEYPEVKRFVDFIENSERGIVGPRK